MITVWGRTNSPNVTKVLWTLDELELAYERIDAGGAFGLTGDPEYLAMNPNGRIPVCRDGDVVIWESNAIVRYLASRYGKGLLWHENAGRRSLDDRWMDWASLTFYQPVLALHRAAKMEAGAARDEAVAKARVSLDEPVSVLSRVLKDKEHIAGDAFGIGDIALAPHVHRLMNAAGLFEPGDAIVAYHRRIARRAAFSRHAASIL